MHFKSFVKIKTIPGISAKATKPERMWIKYFLKHLMIKALGFIQVSVVMWTAREHIPAFLVSRKLKKEEQKFKVSHNYMRPHLIKDKLINISIPTLW